MNEVQRVEEFRSQENKSNIRKILDKFAPKSHNQNSNTIQGHVREIRNSNLNHCFDKHVRLSDYTVFVCHKPISSNQKVLQIKVVTYASMNRSKGEFQSEN